MYRKANLRRRKEQELNLLKSGCLRFGTIQQEFFHVLGFTREIIALTEMTIGCKGIAILQYIQGWIHGILRWWSPDQTLERGMGESILPARRL